MSVYLSLEAASAAAGAGGVGVLEDKSAAHHFVFEIDLCPIEIEIGFHIAKNLHPVGIHFFIAIGFGLFGEVEHVAEAAASAAFDTDTKLGRAVGQLLIGNDLLDFLGRAF